MGLHRNRDSEVPGAEMLASQKWALKGHWDLGMRVQGVGRCVIAKG